MSTPLPNYNLFVEGTEQPLNCSPAQTVSRSLIDGGVLLEANCGGKGTCGKCKIELLHGQVADKNGNPAPPRQNNTYLACQIYPQGDLSIRLKALEASPKGQISDVFFNDEPLIKKVALMLQYPTVENHYSMQEMIWQALNRQESDACIPHGCSVSFDDVRIIRRLSEIIEARPEQITVTLFDNQFIAVEAGDTAQQLYGIAFDIGTTTVVGMLVDINAGKVSGICTKTNPQASFGADVISRIQATHELLGGLEALSLAIQQCLNSILEELCTAAGISPNNVYGASIVGNSTMVHLVLGISPSTLVCKPYAGLFKRVAPVCAEDIELAINPNGRIILLPNIASFVGSDTTAAALAVDQDIVTSPLLLVDLGTNGEMVLHNEKKFCACSTAAGPAFEGSHIRDGMRAATGAICDVTITDDVRVEVIGNGRPAGICGSGMVKAIAELIKLRVIGPSGRFNHNNAVVVSSGIGHRLKKKDNQWEFVLVEGKDSATGADISVTQADIRQIQLVKSSICTGILFLMDQLPAEEALQVCLAGAFGNYIDIESAITIGMFPGFTREAIHSVGNAAGTGAAQVLLSSDRLRRGIQIANKISYLELAAQPSFQNIFLKNLSFPEVV